MRLQNRKPKFDSHGHRRGYFRQGFFFVGLCPFLHFASLLGAGAKVATGLAVGMKAAVTNAAALIVTVHADVPELAPDHPANVAPGHGVSVKSSTVVSFRAHARRRLRRTGR